MGDPNDWTLHWAQFLDARARLIRAWRNEGRSYIDIERELSMYPGQAEVIDRFAKPPYVTKTERQVITLRSYEVIP